MAERVLHLMPDAELSATVRELRDAIAWPAATSAADATGGPDIAALVRARIEAVSAQGAEDRTGWTVGLSGLRVWRWRPARRALVLALIVLLAVAAIAGAIGLGLPGLRILLGQAPTLPATAPPIVQPSGSTTEPLGASMGLGEALDAEDAAGLDTRAGFAVSVPADTTIGPPDAAYIDPTKGGQVTLLWATGPALPATLEPGVGLLLSQFRGTVDEGFFVKAANSGTEVERVRVAGRGAFWLSGDPHLFFWEGAGGFVDDVRRWVGDVLLWSDGPITYRLETSLGRDEAIRIAESLP